MALPRAVTPLMLLGRFNACHDAHIKAMDVLMFRVVIVQLFLRIVEFLWRRFSLHSYFREERSLMWLILGLIVPIGKSKSSFVLLCLPLEFFYCVLVVLIVAIVLIIFIDNVGLQAIPLPTRCIVGHFSSPDLQIQWILKEMPLQLRSVVLLRLMRGGGNGEYSAIVRRECNHFLMGLMMVITMLVLMLAETHE